RRRNRRSRSGPNGNRRSRSQRQRRRSRRVDAHHLRSVARRGMGERIGGTVLVGEIFVRGRESDSRKPLLVERRMIPAAPEPVVPEPHVDDCFRVVKAGDPPDESRQLPRRGVVRVFRKDENAPIVDDAVSADFTTYDVVVKKCLNFLVLLLQPPGQRPSADQSLFLTGESNENERRVEFVS